MSQTHTSYKVSKALKEFLGKDAPAPMNKYLFWEKVKGERRPMLVNLEDRDYHDDRDVVFYPAYQLHDLLSKPFCKAMAKNLKKPLGMYCETDGASNISKNLHFVYYWHNGLPAVEAELMRMMGKE